MARAVTSGMRLHLFLFIGISGLVVLEMAAAAEATPGGPLASEATPGDDHAPLAALHEAELTKKIRETNRRIAESKYSGEVTSAVTVRSIFGPWARPVDMYLPEFTRVDGESSGERKRRRDSQGGTNSTRFMRFVEYERAFKARAEDEKAARAAKLGCVLQGGPGSSGGPSVPGSANFISYLHGPLSKKPSACRWHARRIVDKVTAAFRSGSQQLGAKDSIKVIDMPPPECSRLHSMHFEPPAPGKSMPCWAEEPLGGGDMASTLYFKILVETDVQLGDEKLVRVHQRATRHVEGCLGRELTLTSVLQDEYIPGFGLAESSLSSLCAACVVEVAAYLQATGDIKGALMLVNTWFSIPRGWKGEDHPGTDRIDRASAWCARRVLEVCSSELEQPTGGLHVHGGDGDGPSTDDDGPSTGDEYDEDELPLGNEELTARRSTSRADAAHGVGQFGLGEAEDDITLATTAAAYFGDFGPVAARDRAGKFCLEADDDEPPLPSSAGTAGDFSASKCSSRMQARLISRGLIFDKRWWKQFTARSRQESGKWMKKTSEKQKAALTKRAQTALRELSHAALEESKRELPVLVVREFSLIDGGTGEPGECNQFSASCIVLYAGSYRKAEHSNHVSLQQHARRTPKGGVQPGWLRNHPPGAWPLFLPARDVPAARTSAEWRKSRVAATGAPYNSAQGGYVEELEANKVYIYWCVHLPSFVIWTRVQGRDSAVWRQPVYERSIVKFQQANRKGAMETHVGCLGPRDLANGSEWGMSIVLNSCVYVSANQGMRCDGSYRPLSC